MKNMKRSDVHESVALAKNPPNDDIMNLKESSSSMAAAANSNSNSSEEPEKQSEAEQPQLVPAPSPTSSQQQEKNDNEITEESPPLIDIDSLASVRSLKDPKLIKGRRRRHDSPSDGPATMYITPIKQVSSSSSPTTPETHKITITTISSAPSSANSVISDLSIQKAYRQHKQTTPKSSGGALHDILEDVQFCGMYFCGEFLAINNNDVDSPDDSPDDDPIEVNENITTEQVVTISKEERMKEMDDTFLGKMIQCGDIGDSCGTSGDYILFRPEEERNEDFAPALRAHKTIEREASKA